MAFSEKTEEELRSEITVFNTAIGKLIAGERMRSFTVGSGEFQRRYSYAEVTLEEITMERDQLLQLLSAMTTTTSPYRASSLAYAGYDKGLG